MSYQWHPIAGIFPLLDDDKIASLAADIKANGLKSSIILFEGKILDGRNRATACNLAGVTPRYEEFKGTKLEAVAHVWSLNMERRHLDSSQAAAAVASRLKFDEEFAKEVEAVREEAKKRPNAGRPKAGDNSVQNFVPNLRDTTALTDHKLAEAAGTNRTYVAQARKLLDEAPEEHEKVLRGEKKLHQAVKDMHRPKGSCTNPNKDKPTADWPEMIKWCARQKAVSKGSLMERYSNNEGDCRKRLAIAAQTAGYIVTYLGDGEYRVRKAITLATDSADQKEHATHLRDTAKAYLQGLTSATASSEWSYQKQVEFLHEVIRFTDGLSG